MFIKKGDFKCIKIFAKCDTRAEYVYCCHFTITFLSCEKYINLVIPMLRLFTKKWIKYILNYRSLLKQILHFDLSQKAEKRCRFFPEFYMSYFRVCLSSRVSRDAEYFDVLQTSKEYFTDESKSTLPTFDRLRRIIYG